MARLICPDVQIGGSPLHFLLQLLKPLDNAMHAFERILALVLQTNVRGLPEHPNAQRNRAAVRVPNDAAGRLCQEHADAATDQSSLRCQPCRAALASRLFIGNQRQADPAIQFLATFLQRENGVEHRDNPALHVAGAASKQKMAFARRLELLSRLRGNNIVMSVKVENAISASIACNQTDGAVARSLFRIASL